jgi:hypothetical protein
MQRLISSDGWQAALQNLSNKFPKRFGLVQPWRSIGSLDPRSGTERNCPALHFYFVVTILL